MAVCPSGNLANIYFTREPGRLSLEYLVATYPGLVEGLASHPGVGFVMVYSEARGHVVLGPKGFRDLDSDNDGINDVRELVGTALPRRRDRGSLRQGPWRL